MATNRLNVTLKIVGQHLLNGQIYPTEAERQARAAIDNASVFKFLGELKNVEWTPELTGRWFNGGNKQVVLFDGPVRIIGFEPNSRFPF